MEFFKQINWELVFDILAVILLAPFAIIFVLLLIFGAVFFILPIAPFIWAADRLGI